MKIIHKIGLGSVQFGIPYGISNQTGKTSEEEVVNILAYAKEQNITLIDTASAYGNAEEVLGNNKMTNFKIVSKFMPPAESVSIVDQIEKSLNHLKIEQLYGYLAHRPVTIYYDPDQWSELLRLKAEGKICKIGFSLNTVGELELLLKQGFHPDLIQVPYNYFDRRFEKHLIELHSGGCEIHTRSSFLQGLFFMNVDNLPSFFNPVKPLILSLQNKYGSVLSEILLKYSASKPFIDYVITGVENLQQLHTNLEGLEHAEVISNLDFSINEDILMPSKWPNP